MGQYPTDEEIRKRVLKRFEERQGFLVHLGIYLAVNLFLITAWILGSMADGEALELPGPFIVAFFWGIGLVAHGLNYYYEHGAGAYKREERIQREIERERERLYSAAYGGKRKNEELIGLDGELVLDYDEDDEDRPQRRAR